MKKEIGKRHRQVGEFIRRELSRIFQEGRFEHRISGVFSFTEVQPSRGFETAIVFVSTLDIAAGEELAYSLNDIASEIRYELAASANMRTTPTLIFKTDNALGYANRIEELLNSEDVKKDLE